MKKFIKGLIFGSALSAGVVLMYNESGNMSARKIIKKGKKILKEFV